jgi:hypothetical protein
MQKINTGNYRVCRDQTGIGGTKQVLITGSREDINQYWSNLQGDAQWNYYREEEAFYRDTQTDASGNPIDTIPGWNRMHG